MFTARTPNFSMVLRANIDPFGHEMDARRITLDTYISTGGTNLSVGRRQIFALASLFRWCLMRDVSPKELLKIKDGGLHGGSGSTFVAFNTLAMQLIESLEEAISGYFCRAFSGILKIS
ncbi:hypothetical protein K438DRAFT_1748461 [Mycena galopus ATCC 62051]|nr:hypothetical protein K438DRAFT_1748461 [Mycena galopus ATCC 62051]